jgi:hypothetical protein
MSPSSHWHLLTPFWTFWASWCPLPTPRPLSLESGVLLSLHPLHCLPFLFPADSCSLDLSLGCPTAQATDPGPAQHRGPCAVFPQSPTLHQPRHLLGTLVTVHSPPKLLSLHCSYLPPILHLLGFLQGKRYHDFPLGCPQRHSPVTVVWVN